MNSKKMKYYKILKDNEVIGTGLSDTDLPISNDKFSYVAITKKQWEKLNKTLFNE